jgi:hypothetical protein
MAQVHSSTKIIPQQTVFSKALWEKEPKLKIYKIK